MLPPCSHTPHFLTGQYTHNTTRLDDEPYSQALDTLVKACNDIVLFNPDNTQVLLGKRTQWPQRDWWYGCGGRMRAGESFAQCTHRLLQRELRITIDTTSIQSRIETIGHYWYLWGKREQLPQTNGTGDISCVLALTLTHGEIQQMQQSEYEDVQWVDFADVVTGKEYHPALRRTMLDYVKLCLHKQLYSLTVYQKRVCLLPAGVTLEVLVNQQNTYFSNNNAIDKSITSADLTPTTPHTVSFAPARAESDKVTADEIAAAAKECMTFCAWLTQLDSSTIVAIEYQ